MFKNLKSCLIYKLKQALGIYELEDKKTLLTRNNEALNKDIKILYGKINAMVNNLDSSTVNLISAINESFAKGCSIEVSKRDGIVSYGFLYNTHKEEVVEKPIEVTAPKKKSNKKESKLKKH